LRKLCVLVLRLCEVLQVDDVDKVVGMELLNTSCIADNLLPYCIDGDRAERKLIINSFI